MTGGRTNDRTPTITGTISAALAADQTLRIFNGSSAFQSILLGTATINNTALTWSFTPTLPATAGTIYALTARVADGAGNLGVASARRSFVLDTTPPSVASSSPPDGATTDQAGNPYAGSSTYDILSFSATVDRLTGLAGGDTFRLSSLSHSLLPAAAGTPIDRITDLVTGLDAIDAPMARSLAKAMNPVALGSVSALSASAIKALLTPTSFPALTTTSTDGVASFSFNDPSSGIRTFLAINDGVAGFSASRDAIIEITGFSGNLSQLQVY